MYSFKVGGTKFQATDVFVDSRQVQEGGVFIAYKGVKVDSHKFVEDALKKGADFIVGELPFTRIKKLAPSLRKERYIKVENGRKAWAILEAQKHGNPQRKLRFIGITGTDGKTTTSHFTYHILQAAGFKVGLVSTVAAYFGDQKINIGAHVTTPTPDKLFSVLKNMVDMGIEYVVLEVTSHGLEQERVHGIEFDVVGITNVTPEHLDAHGTFDNYVRTKAKIFERTKNVVLIKDAPGIKEISTYLPKEVNLHLIGDPRDVLDRVRLGEEFVGRFPGEYNFLNAVLAAKMAQVLGVKENAIYEGLRQAVPPEGRFQRVDNPLGLNIIIDFAHTPNAVQRLLEAARAIRKKGERIIVVFGSAGERDPYKRPKMGKVASELADVVILTMEDPRSEDPYQIAFQMASGNPDYPFIIQVDRSKAIELAIRIANKGDWIFILGKGHEDEMNIGGVEHPWSDLKEVQNAIKLVSKERRGYVGEVKV